MKTYVKYLLFITTLLFYNAVESYGQVFQYDTLELKVFFKRDISTIDLLYRDNDKNILDFKKEVEHYLTDSSAVINKMTIQTSASPEGSVNYNQALSEARAKSIRYHLTHHLNINPFLIETKAIGEDWDGLYERLASMSNPPYWRDEVLNIIQQHSSFDTREQAIKKLEGGVIWRWLDEYIFPELRAAGGLVRCILQRPIREIINQTDTVYVSVPYAVTDTLVIQSGGKNKKEKKDLSGKKFLFAARTNILAVPLANVGIEIPLNKHWSFGVDYYYPWIWRDDIHKTCNELLALDLELRYWFNNHKAQKNSRLLGHSIGIYGAYGYYDFERNWFGHQGQFINAGIDYIYSCPIFRGSMHMEFELGIGYIYSRAQPYDCFKAGDKCYRRVGIKKHIHWIGPTRAQISLVIPIYCKKKEVKNETH